RWILVPPQALIPRMAQLARGGPLAEPDLADEIRLDPVHPRLWQPAARERGGLAPEARERPLQAGQRRLGEPGADLAGAGQLALGDVVAEEEGRKPVRGARGAGEAADDELLAVQALELEPVVAASRPVRRFRPLGDQAFPAPPARLRVVGLAVAVAVRGEAQRPGEGDQVAQDPLALAQRQGPDVNAVRVADVQQGVL